MPFFSSVLPLFKNFIKCPTFWYKNHENLTKNKEVSVFSLKPEVAGKTPAVTIFYSVLILLQRSLIGKYLRQFWHITLMTIPQLHTGKCIPRFAGIYAYCRYFLDRM